MRDIDPNETVNVPDLTPETDSDEETLSMFNFSGNDGDRKVEFDDDGEVIITRTYTVTDEEFEELQRCFQDQALSPRPDSGEVFGTPDLSVEDWGRFGQLQFAGRICSTCFESGVQYVYEDNGSSCNNGI